MTQIASLVAVATVFLTYGPHFIVREGAYMHKTTYRGMQKLVLI